MKIVIAGLSAPTQLNGVSRHAANLVRGLLSLPNPPEIHLLAGAWQSVMFAQAIGSADARLHIHPIAIPHRNLARLYWYYRDLPRIAGRLAADVVHLSYTMPLDRRAFACPTVVSLHDLYPFDIPQNFGLIKGPVNQELMHHCLRNVDAIACVSGSTRGRLQQRFGAALNRKAATIFNALEPAAVAPVRPQALDPGWPFLLCIAQHRVNKNIPLAVRVFERLLRQGIVRPGAKLLVIGIPGPETARIQAQIRQSGLQHRVILLSGIGESELQWCYRNCELLLAPSSIEGFGLPVAEALLAGCRVVCSDIAAFREIGAGRCRYVPFGEGVLERYADAIREALEQPRLAPTALPRLAPAVIAREYLALYTRLLALRRTSPSELAFYADSTAEEFDAAEAG
jgi:glycosyltransferase involved in cell wall biosynthesis